MAWRDFGASHEPGTCQWCGQRLKTYHRDRKKLGGYGDNLFCGAACGYQFGVVMAVSGKRIQLRPETPLLGARAPGEEEPDEEDENE